MDFKHRLAELIKSAPGFTIDFSADEIMSAIEVPPNPAMGDFAYPCFRLSKTHKKAPAALASELSALLDKPTFISQITAAGPYVNFFVNKAVFAEEVVSCVLKHGRTYGKSALGHGKSIVIDYSSPNIAKPFHVGHLRSTVIGGALYNILSFIGYTTIGVNHLGDWGTQFGKLITAYKKWGDEKAVIKDGITELTRLYVRFHDEAEKDPSLNDEARSWLVKMQDGDKEALDLWQWFNDISLVEFNKIYDKLGIKFDAFTGESFYNDKMEAIVKELKQKKLLKKSEGALIVDLEQFNMPPCLIIRTDGGTLYPTRDITAAIYRKNTYDFDKCLYLTAIDQNLHFQQWFKVVSLMGYNWAKDLLHIPFGLVSFESGKLSTRKGNVVLMEDLLNEAVQKTMEIIEDKNPALENKDIVAKQVGIGAVIFNDLFNSRIKDVIFSFEKMLNFEGETGPYVQYAHARACGVLEKAGKTTNHHIDYSRLTDETSVSVIKTLYDYPAKILEAATKYEPFVLTRHLVAIAQAFNKFYHENEILGSESDTKAARLALVYCVKVVLERGLMLLGIQAPEKM